jgi:pyruvate-formate lyase-activating enzyme
LFCVRKVTGMSVLIIADSEEFRSRALVLPSPKIGKWRFKGRVQSTFDALRSLMRGHDSAIVVRTSGRPFPPGLLDRFTAFFAGAYDYSHWDASHVCLPEIVVEGITRTGLENLRHVAHTALPGGLLNGYALPRSAPCLMTREECGFYLINHAEFYAKPRAFTVEVTPNCNLTCVKCQYHSSLQEKRPDNDQPSFMTFESWRILIDKIAEFAPGTTISPAARGEPLLHREISKFVRYATGKGLKVGFSTNGNLLTPDVSRSLIDSGISGLNVSLDTLKEDRYRELQPGGNLRGVIGNVESFLKLRTGKHPSIGIHFVESPENTDEFDEFKSFWLQRLDTVSRAPCLDFKKGYRAWKTYLKPGERLPCSWMWQNMYIHANGKAARCGADLYGDLGLGDCLRQELDDIWPGEPYRRIRESQAGTKNPDLSFCRADMSWTAFIAVTKIEHDEIVTVSPMYMCYAKLPGKRHELGLKMKGLLQRMPLVSDATVRKLTVLYKKHLLK